MKKVKLGIIKEGRIPPDLRTPLTPSNCKDLLEKYSDLEIYLQPCSYRCYTKTEYEKTGVIVQQDLSNCDILLGIKEVPVNELIPGKTYLFFSHTIKKQVRNQELLAQIIRKKIRLIDYEALTYDNGVRIIGFGKFAGIVGTHNGFIAWGNKTGTYKLKPAHQCKDYNELKLQYKSFTLPPFKIVLTGSGRVSNGALELLEFLKIKKITPEQFLSKNFNEAVYVQLDIHELYSLKNDSQWNDAEFFNHPEKFISLFKPYTESCDLLINGIYWSPKAPILFSLEEMKSKNFRIKVIADITCDIEGSIPCTYKATTIEDPVFGYEPLTNKIVSPYQNNAIDIMAVDNLPCELPRDASAMFGQSLIKDVLKYLINAPDNPIISRATITRNGDLTPRFEYLRGFLELQKN